MTYREVTRKLKALGCQELLRRGGGSHRKWLNLPRSESQPFLIGAVEI